MGPQLPRPVPRLLKAAFDLPHALPLAMALSQIAKGVAVYTLVKADWRRPTFQSSIVIFFLVPNPTVKLSAESVSCIQPIQDTLTLPFELF